MMRIEKDHIGELQLPQETLHGIHTERALSNFPITGELVPIELVTAIAEVKRAAIEVNAELGFIETDKADAMITACDEIITGSINYEFTLPALQGGAGTSTNMCINEVIANRALQILGYNCGEYSIIHPIEMVNLHQSTNDVYPTALRMVVIRKVRKLSESIASLQGELQKKEQEFASILTMGRTELQDAVPITLGSQFASFAQAIERDRWRCFKAEERIRMVNIGGTAVGTGLTAPRKYIFRVIEKLRANTGLPIGRADHVMDATANCDPFVEVSATLLSNAVNLIKISTDLRFLHVQKEISLPQLQAGSSIMPGKVNPVIIESVIQLAMKAKSQCALVADLSSMGSLQINEYLPLIASTIISLIDGLNDAVNLLIHHVPNIVGNREICERKLFSGTAIITAFVPIIGYDKAEELVHAFENQGESNNFRSFLKAQLGDELVESELVPAKLMALGYRLKKK